MQPHHRCSHTPMTMAMQPCMMRNMTAEALAGLMTLSVQKQRIWEHAAACAWLTGFCSAVAVHAVSDSMDRCTSLQAKRSACSPHSAHSLHCTDVCT